MIKKTIEEPNRLLSYFKTEKWTLLLVTISGLFYNAGITVGPWFEGKLAQCLYDIIGGDKTFKDMVFLAFSYILAIGFVQLMRSIKRFYVRRFANNVNRNMKQVVYNNLIHKPKTAFENESVGQLMTKTIADVDACTEGMRKFTTEIFDTGVAMISYVVMLMSYDWHLACICMIFPPFAYVMAQLLKKVVTRCTFEFRESAGRLNGATLARITNALTYRVYGQEENQDRMYEERLEDYEKKAVYANMWENMMQPVYKIISMISMIFILWFGVKNVMGTGFVSWNIAAFTTFESCFTKLALKSSRAAKLFNSIQKAEVSWKRMKPLMKKEILEEPIKERSIQSIQVRNLGFAYPQGKQIFSGLNFDMAPGQVIGVTGPVACGKSTLGKTFLCEYPYEGEILIDGKDLQQFDKLDRLSFVGFMGHQPELMSDTVKANISLGDKKDVRPYLEAVCLEHEVSEDTLIGNGGVRLSGGQQARVALARTLYHKRPLIILDDPFSAVDAKTEIEIMTHIRELTKDSIVMILSHRLYLFPEFDRIIWMEEGKCSVGTHEELMKTKPEYQKIYQIQMKGDGNNDFRSNKTK